MAGMKKLINQRGFSLFESMVALLIIALLTVGISTGVKAAAGIYKRSLFVSEGDVLAATLDTALSDVLRYSSSISEEDGTVQFTNTNYSMVNGHLVLKDGWLYLNLTDEEADDASDPSLTLLLSGGIYSSMEIESFTLNYSDGVFSGNYVIQSKEDAALEKSYDFYFRTLS
ncbi:type II secretion system protein [Anaerotignum sp.]|uniref:type II secretion system protein n=1 Tax=Anaerotignum sp. TaxID=2039241 RepID=UPI002714B5D5|nr:prepilin-type N-terminal cleavage/methylation domain-containing protein [Anaerotignum sp.]